jgi:tetratricopeptide (TPR) repeat protein
MKVKSLQFPALFCLITFFIVSCNNAGQKESKGKTQNVVIQQENSESLSSNNIGVYEGMLKTDSLNTEIRLKVAAYYYLNKNFEKALAHYLAILQNDKNNLATLFNLGNIYYDIQQNEQAIKYYERLLALDENNSNVRCDLATCYMNLNNTSKAIAILRENIKLDTNHLQSHYNLSVMLRKTGKTVESEKELSIYNAMSDSQKGATQ